jgi:hypothetical protein
MLMSICANKCRWRYGRKTENNGFILIRNETLAFPKRGMATFQRRMINPDWPSNLRVFVSCLPQIYPIGFRFQRLEEPESFQLALWHERLKLTRSHCRDQSIVPGAWSPTNCFTPSQKDAESIIVPSRVPSARQLRLLICLVSIVAEFRSRCNGFGLAMDDQPMRITLKSRIFIYADRIMADRPSMSFKAPSCIRHTGIGAENMTGHMIPMPGNSRSGAEVQSCPRTRTGSSWHTYHAGARVILTCSITECLATG